MGLAWRPAGEAICSEMYSTSKTNLPGSVRLHDLQESWARMFPEMARYTNKADQICARVPEYLKQEQRGSAKKRKAPVVASVVKKKQVVSAWDGFAVDQSSDVTTFAAIDDIDLDAFEGL